MMRRIISCVLVSAILMWNGFVYVPLIWAEEPAASEPANTEVTETSAEGTEGVAEEVPPAVPIESAINEPANTEATENSAEVAGTMEAQPAENQEQVENSALVTNEITSNANSGDNTINVVDDTAAISEIDVTPSPEPQDTSQDQDLSLLTQVSSEDSAPQSSEENSSSTSPDPSTDPLLENEDESNGENLASLESSEQSNSPSECSEQNMCSPEIDSGAKVENEIQSTANTGDNNIGGTSSSSVENATLETGDAVSTVILDNSVNSTSVNSTVVYQTINIFNMQDSSLDLTTAYDILADIFNNDDKKNEEVINVSVTGIGNYAYIANAISSNANTGGNSVSSEENAAISTGNAYSIVTLLNKANVTLIDSVIHVVTINIFGELNGNIVLPSLSPIDADEGQAVIVENSTEVSNVVESNATSGENSATVENDASIATGQAVSVVNAENILNTYLYGTVFYDLSINTFGEWIGQFIGWDIFPSSSDQDLSIVGTTGANGDSSGFANANVANTAVVSNNILSSAVTGGNSATGESASITTGNSVSVVSIFNFVNSTLYKSVGFFGFINIFGRWVGNIGGVNEFANLDSQSASVNEGESNNQDQLVGENQSAENENLNEENEESQGQRAEGGALEIKQANNVGEYVLPGDTVTFFMTVKNVGSGMVYDAKLQLNLIKDGVDAGGVEFNLGNISVGKGAKVTTGLVLSEGSPSGEYIARAYVTGNVGESNSQVSATSDSIFSVGNGNVLAYNTEKNEYPSPSGSVLGAKRQPEIANGKNSSTQMFPILYLLLLACYLEVKLLRRIGTSYSVNRPVFISKSDNYHRRKVKIITDGIGV